jgi:MoaA/NifB/PqqE/SkfB family radical SAM enzyme
MLFAMLSKWTNLGRDIWLSNAGRLPAPYKLTYAVTARCNSRCQHCLIWQQKPADELRVEEIALFAQKNNHWAWIDFTGGEPTLRNDFVVIVWVFLDSNAVLFFIHLPKIGFEVV